MGVVEEGGGGGGAVEEDGGGGGGAVEEEGGLDGVAVEIITSEDRDDDLLSVGHLTVAKRSPVGRRREKSEMAGKM
ncbi:hypothetical protein Tco_0684166 [Tanacetum coccineum]